MGETSARLGLPLLVAGQAQKEITHNEALVLADALLLPVVQAIGTATPPSAPADGESWVVGPAATDAWSGRDGMLAIRTEGGWRFVPPPQGMIAWRSDLGEIAVRTAAGWTGMLPAGGLAVGGDRVVGPRGAAVADPVGGTAIDAEARAAIVAILSRLRAHGLIAG